MRKKKNRKTSDYAMLQAARPATQLNIPVKKMIIPMKHGGICRGGGAARRGMKFGRNG